MGDEWLAGLPDNALSAEYGDYLLQGISDGVLVCDWAEVVSVIGSQTATLRVTEDALYVALSDETRFRPQVSAALAQRCADALGALLPTSKILDLAYDQSFSKLTAQPLDITPLLTAEERDYVAGIGAPHGGTRAALMPTKRMSQEYNARVEAERAQATGLVRDIGKAWLLSNALGYKAPGKIAVNYGFYATSTPTKYGPYRSASGHIVWQTRGTAHDAAHSDYSQTIQLVAAEVDIDGEPRALADLLGDVHDYHFVSDEGPIRFLRQP
jgi:hypothetical protein